MKKIILTLILINMTQVTFAQESKIDELQNRIDRDKTLTSIGLTGATGGYLISKTYQAEAKVLEKKHIEKIKLGKINKGNNIQELIVKSRSAAVNWKLFSVASLAASLYTGINSMLNYSELEHEMRNETKFIDETRKIPAREISSKEKESTFNCEEQ